MIRRGSAEVHAARAKAREEWEEDACARGCFVVALLLQFRSALQSIIRLTRENLQAPRE